MNRIVSPVVIIFPDESKIEYKFGTEACEAVFDHKYEVDEIRAADNKIEIALSEVESRNDDETFF